MKTWFVVNAKFLLVLTLSVIFIRSTLFISVSYAEELNGFNIRIQSGATPVIDGHTESLALNNPGTPHVNENIRDIISLQFDPYSQIFKSNPVSVKVELIVTDGSSNVIGTPELIIHINPWDNSLNEFVDKHSVVYNGYTIYDVEVDKIWVDEGFGSGFQSQALPEYCFIELEIKGQRYHQLNSNISLNYPLIYDSDADGVQDAALVSWLTVTGAEEYQLEWVYVNDYEFDFINYVTLPQGPRPLSDLKYNFRNNSTRVNTDPYNVPNRYKINLLYDRGYIVYRVRAVGRDLTDTKIPVYTEWSIPNPEGVVGNQSALEVLPIPFRHEIDMNWQYSATYAEEGKRKEVINYFDGSLRNRQTVTQVNSENDVIVGQSIYDYNGRPALQVLPVPVMDRDPIYHDPAVRYYKNFNTTNGLDVYKRDDFDQDRDPCVINTPSMASNDGASHYYSPYYTNISDFSYNSFIPDAYGYPFSQVEYTPDQTGRIRRQGGVGAEFQLGKAHETKYYYGQPDQLEMDRMFGSEVGDVSHYKKNIVIDANGQSSIVYLDQEGRTIATALAGDTPSLTPGQPILQPLPSNPSVLNPDNPLVLTVDLFNEDDMGVSSTNKLNQDGDGIEFISQLLVDYAGNYNFEYNIEINPFEYACEETTLCYNCAYDFIIQIKDECGLVVATNINAESSRPPVVQFNASAGCYSLPDNYNEPTTHSFNLTLAAGDYQIVKKLVINKEARDKYLAHFLNGANSTCHPTFEEILEQQISAIDMSGCYQSCDECLQALGDREVFVSSQLGTYEDYDILAEQCKEPCNPVSLCELSYKLMLADVSRGGQYGEWMDLETGIIDPSLYPLSVFNENNQLPVSMSGGEAFWQHPKRIKNGVTNYQYFETGDVRTKISFDNPDPAAFVPPLKDLPILGSNYFQDAPDEPFYTYPEYLLNVSDFLAKWERGWEESLVIYHPEYNYYKSCSDLLKPQSNQDISSQDFDEKLVLINSYGSAVANGYITANGVINFIDGPTTPFDPFAIPGSYFQTHPFANLTFNIHDYIEYKINHYTQLDGNWLTMQQTAALTVNAAGNYGVTPIDPDWLIFGPPETDQVILDKQWSLLRGFYLSLKQEAEWRRAREYSYVTPGFNSCIGNPDFGADEYYDVINYYRAAGYGWPVILNLNNYPCAYNTYSLYLNKDKRFMSHQDVEDVDETSVAYEMYLQTGQCPNAFNVQTLLNGLAVAGKLDNTPVDLKTIPEFSEQMYEALINGPLPSIYEHFDWVVTNSNFPLLEVEIQCVSGIYNDQLFGIKLSQPSIFSTFDEIVAINGLRFTAFDAATGRYGFTANAAKLNSSNSTYTYTYEVISGYITLNIGTCSFPPVCNANDLAKDLQKLMTGIANIPGITGGIYQTTPLILSHPYVSMLVTDRIRNTIGAAPGINLTWNATANPGEFEIYETTTGPKLTILFTATDPTSFAINQIDDLLAFSDIVSNYQNFFTIKAYDLASLQVMNGPLTVTLSGEAYVMDGTVKTPVLLGECDMPLPAECEEDGHLVLFNLVEVINDQLSGHIPPNPIQLDLFDSQYLSNLTMSYLLPPQPIGGNNINECDQNIESITEEGVNFELFTMDCESCVTTIKHKKSLSPLYNLNHLVGIKDLIGNGDEDLLGNYHSFVATGLFMVNGAVIESEITGTTCLPLKNCSECPDEPQFEPTPIPHTAAEVAIQDNLDLAAGKLMPNEHYLVYQFYDSLVNATLQRFGWTSGSPFYFESESQEDFTRNSRMNIFNSYKLFASQFDTIIDDWYVLANLDSFSLRYGNLKKCNYEFDKYQRSIQEFNALADPLNQMTIVNEFDFYENHLCDFANSYANIILNDGYLPDSLPPDIITRFGDTNSNSQDSCMIYYNRYVAAYEYFVTNNFNRCPIPENYPLYDIQVFIDRFLCCPAGYPIFDAFINSFYLNMCPNPLPEFGSCGVGLVLDEAEECEKEYLVYKQMVAAYNTAPYPLANNYKLIDPLTVYDNFMAFEADGRCNCINSYLIYLQPFLNPTITTLNSFKPSELSEFVGCGETGTEDPCATAYEDYLVITAEYNQFVEDNPTLGYPQIVYRCGPPYFNCNCVGSFAAYLQGIMNGTITNLDSIYVFIYIERWCDDFLDPINSYCIDPAADTIQSPSYTPPDPCVEQAMNLAYFNANLYFNYYLDSMTTVFSTAYRNHCLGASENFIEHYTDRRYHYTLYYYDQAGNLIRTIPPEGVRLKEIDEYSDTEAQAIRYDRKYGTHNVFTEHQMPTNYEYNSLNQLVKQSLPDHDKMEITDFVPPQGIHDKLRVNSVHFTDASNGWISGYVDPGSGDPLRGYLYKTIDGGKNWLPYQNMVGSDLKNITMVTADVGYAVGSNGTILKTIDGGASWTMILLYNLLVFDEIVDLYFESEDVGVAISSVGYIVYTTDGLTFHKTPTMAYSATSITFDGTNYHISTANGQVYSGTPSIGFTLETVYRVNNLNKVCYVDANFVFAIGDNGTLIKSFNGGTDWFVISTGISNNFREIYFATVTNGIALIDDGGVNRLWKTFDGGQNWEPFVPALPNLTWGDYNGFYEYENGKLIAYGKGGRIAKILMLSAPFSITPMVPPNFLITSIEFLSATAVVHDDVVQGADKLFIAAATSDRLFYTFDGHLTIPAWTTVNIATNPAFGSGSHHLSDLVSVSEDKNIASGMMLNDAGSLFTFCIDLTAALPAFTINAFSYSTPVSDIKYRSGTLYAYESSTNILRQFPTGNCTSWSTIPTNPISTVPTLKDFDFFNGNAITVNADGEIHKFAGVWNEQSDNVRFLPLQHIEAAASGELWACGNDGDIFYKPVSGAGYTGWRMLNTPLTGQLNCITNLNGTGDFAVGGNGGAFYKFNVSGNVVQPSAINLLTTSDVNDIAIDGTTGYVACDNGDVVFLPDYPANTVFPCPNATGSVNMNGLCLLPCATCLPTDPKQIYGVGDNSTLYNYMNASALKNNNLYPVRLKDAHFINSSNGYVIGDNGYIRHTTDGGASWKYVLPNFDLTGNIPVMNKILTFPNNHAYVIGDNYQGLGYVQYLEDIGFTVAPNGWHANVDYNDIESADGVSAFVVGDDGKMMRVIYDDNISWHFESGYGPTTITDDLHALHVFKDNSMFVIGEDVTPIFVDNGGVIQNLNQSFTPPLANPNQIWRDICFVDDRNGYLIGDGGVLYRTSLNANIQSNPDIEWRQVSMEDDFGINYGNTQDIMPSCMAMNTFSTGVIGGLFNPGLPDNYTRIFTDESMLYSTKFWYDKLGRLIVSQNTKQQSIDTPYFSYTLYDELGRIKEVGEKRENSGSGEPRFRSIFGSMVNGYFNGNTIDDAKFNDWIITDANNNLKQVTHTYYDEQDGIILPTNILEQANLRKRVATTTYEEIYDGDPTTYNHATHYSYDIHGNVNTLLQENPDIGISSERYKRIDYQYDLISGKVNKVIYQEDKPDQFIHWYEYDADNRIKQTYTTRDKVHEDLEASYFYYPHGPLARAEIGAEQSQGIDYAYTLQGWLKGINSTVLEAYNDMGNDGDLIVNGTRHSRFARDVFSYSLGYFENDYTPIDLNRWNIPDRFIAYATGSDLTNSRYDLWNGNISSMVTTIFPTYNYAAASAHDEIPTALPLGNSYTYDQLNRIVGSKSWDNMEQRPGAFSYNQWFNSNWYTGKYQTNYEYDSNGNIKVLTRNDANGTLFDYLQYNYHDNIMGRQQNRLYTVNDYSFGSNPIASDLTNQAGFDPTIVTINTANNYGYDGIGNLIRDNSEHISNIEWTVSGKIKKIDRVPGYNLPDLEFMYDASGNRIAKIVKPMSSTDPSTWIYTYYTRDAQGNIMAVYDKQADEFGGLPIHLKELNLYGSSRLGVLNCDIDMSLDPPIDNLTHILGRKYYEGTNHLGNVTSVFTDRKIPRSSNGSSIDFYMADVVNATDYYPFGMIMTERNFGSEGYRFGFNGKENDNEVKTDPSGIPIKGSQQDYGARIYDPRIARFLSLDPLFYKTPDISPYASFNDNPNYFKDPSGKTGEASIYKVTSKAEAERLGVAVGETIVLVEATLIMYGTEAKNLDNHQIANNIEAEWNAAKGVTKIKDDKGKETTYAVRFKVSVNESHLNSPDSKVMEATESNTSYKNNFIRVESQDLQMKQVKGYDKSSASKGYNSAMLLTSDNPETSKTAPHEFGHMFGLPDNLKLNNGEFDIMIPSSNNMYFGNTLFDPTLRKVTQFNIDDLKLDKLLEGKKIGEKANVGQGLLHGIRTKDGGYTPSKKDVKSK